MKNFTKIIAHKWNVFLWEYEVRRATNCLAKKFGIKNGSVTYKMLMNDVANSQRFSG